MKTRILFLVLLSVFSARSYSQLSGGVRAGANYTNVLGANSKDYKFKFGFQAGGYFEYDFASHLSFQMEANYSSKGYHYKHSETMPLGGITYISETTLLTNISYIDVPLILNIHFGEMGSYIGIGPQVSILANAASKGEINNTYTPSPPPPLQNSSITIDEVSRDGLSPIDFGGVFGLGSKYENGMEYCIRAGYGLTSVFDNGGDYHNLVFSVTLGYAFGETSGSYSKDKRYKKKKRRR